MTFLQRWFAWYLEVEISTEPGTVLTWQWLLRSPIPGVPFWVVAMSLLAVFAAVLWSRQRSVEATPRERRRTWRLQLAAVLLLLLILGRFAIQVRLTGLPSLLVLVDTSASMQLEDDYSSREASLLRNQLTMATVTGPVSDRQRLKIAQKVLLQGQGEWLRELQKHYRVVLRPVADGMEAPSSPDRETDHSPEIAKAIERLTARGVRTNLRAALKESLQSQWGQAPAAVVILTDGNSSIDPQDRLTAGWRELGRHRPPVFAVGIGSTTAGRNVEVTEVVPPGLAFVGDSFVVRARLEGTGVAGETVVVQLVDQRTGQLLDSHEAELSALVEDPGRAGAEVTFRHVAETSGPMTLEVRCLPVPGEEQLLDNVLQSRLWVRSAQLRVLLVESVPRWEFRHLKSALERDPSVQLNTVLLESDPEFVREDRTALPFPPRTSEEWQQYDVIVWGGVSLDQLHVPREALDEFVAEFGGGLLLLPDRSRSLVEDFAELSPVQLDSAADRHSAEQNPVRIRATLDGRAAACLQFATAGIDAPLTQLPMLDSPPGDVLLRAGAVTLLEADRERGKPVPLLVEQRYGAGLVMVQRFDSTWKWRPLAQGQVYRQYWSQLMRYLGQRKLDTQRPPYELQVNRPQFGPGMPVHL
ncbi:MAG: VWA domain-containing protein, partial [Planctomycetaceae bacterium]|nr:VWA domain-containing protein [Planctomycetaceae bacterium]